MAITTASNQLFSRDKDEIFSGWGHILGHLREVNERSIEVSVKNLTAVADDNKVYAHTQGSDAEFVTEMNEWSFSQVCKLTGARGAKSTLNRLDAQTSSDAINQLLKQTGENLRKRVNLIHLPAGGGHPHTRAFYSDRYERVSDLEVFTHFHTNAEQFGYEPAGLFAGKRGGLPPVNPEASGLYRGQQSSFGFICNEAGKIDIGDSSLYHAVMFGNSEVGKETLWFQDVLYDFICGNHMIWSPARLRTVKHKHTGDVRDVLQKATHMFRDVDAERYERREKTAIMYNKAIRTQFADTRKHVQEKLANYLTIKDSKLAGEYLEHPAAYPSNPTSVWGVASAITLASQTKTFPDQRRAMDVVGGKLLAQLG